MGWVWMFPGLHNISFTWKNSWYGTLDSPIRHLTSAEQVTEPLWQELLKIKQSSSQWVLKSDNLILQNVFFLHSYYVHIWRHRSGPRFHYNHEIVIASYKWCHVTEVKLCISFISFLTFLSSKNKTGSTYDWRRTQWAGYVLLWMIISRIILGCPWGMVPIFLPLEI